MLQYPFQSTTPLYFVPILGRGAFLIESLVCESLFERDSHNGGCTIREKHQLKSIEASLVEERSEETSVGPGGT